MTTPTSPLTTEPRPSPTTIPGISSLFWQGIAGARLAGVIMTSLTLLACLQVLRWIERGFRNDRVTSGVFRCKSLLCRWSFGTILRLTGFKAHVQVDPQARDLLDQIHSSLSVRQTSWQHNKHSTGGLRNKRPPILIHANHISYMDVLAVGSQIGCNFVAKSEVRSWPIFGSICKLLGGVFVERGQPYDRVRSLYEVRRKLLSGERTCVFPEGTTSNAPFPLKDKWQASSLWSAHQASAQVLCMGIAYSHQDSISWIGGMTFLPHLWATLQRPSSELAIKISLLDFPARQQHRPDIRELGRLSHAEVQRNCQAAMGMLSAPNLNPKPLVCGDGKSPA